MRRLIHALAAITPAGMAGNGTACFPCTLNVSIPFASFSGDSVPRSATVRLFGDVRVPDTVGGFACDQTSALALSWAGDNALGEPYVLTFANQVNQPRLLLPPKSLVAGVISRFAFTACYAANGAQSLCGVAATQFMATITPLVRCQPPSLRREAEEQPVLPSCSCKWSDAPHLLELGFHFASLTAFFFSVPPSLAPTKSIPGGCALRRQRCGR